MKPETYKEGRQVAPSEHAPRKETFYQPRALKETTIREVDSKTAWISMDNESTVEVRR